ncbi:MAG: Holliday junction branch migration protein RuvA [Flavobacteriales bacterium]
MIYFLEGKIEELTPTFVVLNCNGVGYVIQISVRTAEVLKEKKEVRLLTQLIIRDDAHILYGFYEKEDRDCFNMLVTVSGVGVNTARVILSSLSANEVVSAILYDDVNTFKKIKGIGAKTAQRILVDLKDKAAALNITNQIDDSISVTDGGGHNSIKTEALTALTVLGFNNNIAKKVIDKIIGSEEISTVEDLIKKALAKL